MITLLLLASCTFEAPVPPRPAPKEAPPAATPAAPSPTVLVPPPGPSARLQDEQNSVEVFRAVAPATVFVTQSQIVVDRYRMKALEVPAGTGSGFVWDDKGHVVTNYHVVDEAQSLKVTLLDGSEHDATFVGGDPRKDIAVLKVNLPPASLTPVRRPPPGYELEVGQKTLAIGNPFGLDHTLTVGAISALGREVMGYGNLTIKGMIQTDASINPGNSGGPLLDSQGQLIGMNTMIYSQSGSSAGIGFAVPWTSIERVANQIIQYGRVQQVGIGVAIVEDRVTRRQGIEGLVIGEVMAGSPAEKAGLRGVRRSQRGYQIGDVIIGINGSPVRSYDDLYSLLDQRSPGELVKVRVRRDEDVEIEVELPLIEVGIDR